VKFGYRGVAGRCRACAAFLILNGRRAAVGLGECGRVTASPLPRVACGLRGPRRRPQPESTCRGAFSAETSLQKLPISRTSASAEPSARLGKTSRASATTPWARYDMAARWSWPSTMACRTISRPAPPTCCARRTHRVPSARISWRRGCAGGSEPTDSPASRPQSTIPSPTGRVACITIAPPMNLSTSHALRGLWSCATRPAGGRR